jgi:hypothetical protein
VSEPERAEARSGLLAEDLWEVGTYLRKGGSEFVYDEKLDVFRFSDDGRLEKPSTAYQQGWLDGRHGGTGFSTETPHLAEWEGVSDRIAYYRGHREGREARRLANQSPWPGDSQRESASRFR